MTEPCEGNGRIHRAWDDCWHITCFKDDRCHEGPTCTITNPSLSAGSAARSAMVGLFLGAINFSVALLKFVSTLGRMDGIVLPNGLLRLLSWHLYHRLPLGLVLQLASAAVLLFLAPLAEAAVLYHIDFEEP